MNELEQPDQAWLEENPLCTDDGLAEGQSDPLPPKCQDTSIGVSQAGIGAAFENAHRYAIGSRIDAMSTLARWFIVLSCILIPAVTHADELLADLEELYTLTENCSEQNGDCSSLGNGSPPKPHALTQTPRTLGIGVSESLVSCAQPPFAHKPFELGIVAFGDGDFPRAKELFTQLLNRYRDDLLVIDGLYGWERHSVNSVI